MFLDRRQNDTAALVDAAAAALPYPLVESKENNGKNILAITGFFTTLCFITVMLRVYVRTVMTKTMGSDDWIMVAAMVCLIGVFACFVAEVGLGIGKHSDDPSLYYNFSDLMRWNFAHSLLIVSGISLVKISVGFFLTRVVEGTKYKRFIIAMIVFLVVFTLACLGTLIFQCLPVDAAWDLSKKATAKCYDSNTFRAIGLFNGAINIFTDVLFAVLPIPVIWNLNVNLRTKVSLIGVLSLGFFACAAAIVKEVYLSNFFTTPDYSFEDTYAIWNLIEFTIGILAACLPALRPLFAFLLETAGLTFKSTRANSKHKYYMQSNDINLSAVPSSKVKGERYGVSVSTNNKGWEDSKTRFAGVTGKLEQSLTEDDGSEENILPMQDSGNGHKGNRIIKTTEVRVS